MRPNILISAGSILVIGQCLAAGAVGNDVGPGLEALRSGRFEEARGIFSRISAARPEAPDGPFFEAFGVWWKLLDRPEDASLRLGMEQHLEEAARRARMALQGDDASRRERALVLQGVALLIEAQSKAARGAHLSAVSSARQGHRALTQALEADPDDADALFSMGAYNYYADHLPALVKGIRFLLFIPGGDARLGITQLERAAGRSALFGVESLMLLAHIYTGSYEEDYARALGYIDRAVSRCPDSPLIALARADLLYSMGALRESAAAAEATYERIRGKPNYPPELERALLYRSAACALSLHDPIGAMERMEQVMTQMESATVGSPADRKRWLTLWAEAAREAGRSDRLEGWIQRLAAPDPVALSLRRRAAAGSADAVAAPRAAALRRIAAGDAEGGFAAIQALAAAHATDLRLRYDLGRLLQQRGRLSEARVHLTAAAGAGRSNPAYELAGWAMLRLGWELETEGRRDEARALYKRAAAMKQFDFRAAALDRMARLTPTQPEG